MIRLVSVVVVVIVVESHHLRVVAVARFRSRRNEMARVCEKSGGERMGR